MSSFSLYFNLGIDHILDTRGYDHILFIVVLVVSCRPSDWKTMLGLVTGFTVGHMLTLILAMLNVVTIPPNWVELLISITILWSAGSVLLQRKRRKPHFLAAYMVTFFFGLIHGLGFSFYLRSLLGKNQSLFLPLLSFHLGLELGQLIIVVCFLILSFIFVRTMRVPFRYWQVFISFIIVCIACVLIKDRIFW